MAAGRGPAAGAGLGAVAPRGRGYYDRFLEALETAGHRPRTVACCFADEVLPAGEVPAEPHDAVLAEVLTEHGVVARGGSA